MSLSKNLTYCEAFDVFQAEKSSTIILAFLISVENFVPGKADSLGLSYERLSSINPRLIYTSISGYGSTGPHANRAGYDAIAVSLTIFHRSRRFPNPSRNT